MFVCDADNIFEGGVTVADILGPELSDEVAQFAKSARSMLIRGTMQHNISMHKSGKYVILEAEHKVSRLSVSWR